jgi:hypothetical protein
VTPLFWGLSKREKPNPYVETCRESPKNDEKPLQLFFHIIIWVGMHFLPIAGTHAAV